MITIIFLLFFMIGIQLLFKPNQFIQLQFIFCLLLTVMEFNAHTFKLAIL